MDIVKSGQVWIDMDGAALLILEEGKALVLESYTVIEKEDYELLTRATHLEGQINLAVERCVIDQQKYWEMV